MILKSWEWKGLRWNLESWKNNLSPRKVLKFVSENGYQPELHPKLHPESISLVHTCSMAILLLAICKARSSSHNSLQTLNYSNKASLYLYRCEIKKHITQYWLMLPLWLSAYNWCIPSMLNNHNKLTRKPQFLSCWSFFCFCCFSAAMPSFYGKEHQMKLNWWVMSTFFL